jgi:hypothetical protein
MSTSGSPQTRVTLHEELADILRERDNAWMTTSELANAVNHRGRYRKRDGSPASASQIGARIRQYSSQFEREDNRFRLRAALPTASGTAGPRHLMRRFCMFRG